MTADTSKRITNLLPEQIPDFVQDFYPLFVIFITKYFEYIENTSDGVQYTLQNIQLNRDIDTTADNLAIQFLNTYVPGLPDYSEVDQSVLIKHFRDFFQRKGSEKSFKFFFKSFFNDDIDIYYPKDSLFKLSSGNFYQEQTLRVRSYQGNPYNMVNTKVFGAQTGAFANVSAVHKLSGVGGTDYYDLVLEHNSISSFFNPDLAFSSSEAITTTYYDYVNSTSSNIVVSSVSTLTIGASRYLDNKGQLSSNQKLIDSYYYQQFSYVIRSHQDRQTWYDHVLKHLHPMGLALYNDYVDKRSVITQVSSTVTLVETAVKIPTIKSFLSQTNIYSFDRTAAYNTGTSTTQIATTTGFTTVSYTSIGSISFNSSFTNYLNGENITWALQNSVDLINTSTVLTQQIRPGGASFDKLFSTLVLDQQLIGWPSYLNSSVVATKFTAVSSNLAAGTLLTSFTTQTMVLPTLGNSSLLLMMTWMKNEAGSYPAGESSNAIVCTFSSNVTIIPYFDSETQEKYRRVALNRSLEYNTLSYTHSSNTVSTDLTSGLPLSSYSITSKAGRISFKPYNYQRDLTYDRCVIRIDVDQQLQLNTSLTETFNTTNITASGLIATYSSLATGVSTSSFTSTALSVYNFGRNAFVFNNGSDQLRYINTTSFPLSERIDVGFDYLVGDNYNGGDGPEATESLGVYLSTDGGTTFPYFTKIWQGADFWYPGTSSVAGKVWTAAGSTTVTGVGTTFLTAGYAIGDRITINSSLTTAYTISAIISNTQLTISPALVNDYRGTASTITGTASSWAASSQLIGVGTNFVAQLVYGDNIMIAGSSTTNTAYTVVSIVDSSTIVVAPTPVATTSGVTLYKIAGVNAYYKPPANQQFITTSITIASSIPSTSIVVQIRESIESGGGTSTDTDKYAIDNLTVSSWRYQPTTGTVSLSFAVSSNSTVRILGNDFFDITTIGVI